MASIHRLFMKGFTWELQRLIGPRRSGLLLVLHGFQQPWLPYECLITTGLHTWLNKRTLFLILKKKKCLSSLYLSSSCPTYFLPSPCLLCLRLYNRSGITVLIPMDLFLIKPTLCMNAYINHEMTSLKAPEVKAARALWELLAQLSNQLVLTKKQRKFLSTKGVNRLYFLSLLLQNNCTNGLQTELPYFCYTELHYLSSS